MNKFLELFCKLNLINSDNTEIFSNACSFESKNLNNNIVVFVNFNKLIEPQLFYDFKSKINHLDGTLKIIPKFEKTNINFFDILFYLNWITENHINKNKTILINILKRKKGKVENNVIFLFYFNDSEKLALNDVREIFISKIKDFGLPIVSIEISFDKDINEIENYKSNLSDKAILIDYENQKNNFQSQNKERKNFTSKLELENINSLVIEQGNALVQGKIFHIDTIPAKQSVIYKIFINDNTDSLLIKIFPKDKGISKEFLSSLKIGNYIKAKINLIMDNFENNNLVGIATTMLLLDSNNELERVDNEDNKRVELINHTNMTSFEGLISVDDLIYNAKRFNSKYVCVTDKFNCQSFPEIQNKIEKTDINVIYGVQLEVLPDEIEIVKNPISLELNSAEYVIFDLETTGLFPYIDEIIEFGAVKYKKNNIVERLQFFIKPSKPISSKITSITKITNQDLENAISIKDALIKIKNFIGNAVLVAHNGIKFDLPFLNCALEKNNMELIYNPLIDTMNVSRAINENLYSHSLGSIAKKMYISYDDEIAHRADFDADVLYQVWMKMITSLKEKNIVNLIQINKELQNYNLRSKTRGYLINVYLKEQKFLKSFYQLISCSLTENLFETPKILLSKINENRSNFIITNSPTEGDVWDASLSSTSEELKNRIKFYDYILVSPPNCFLHEINRSNINETSLESSIKRIVNFSKLENKKVIASSDTYYLDKNDKDYFNVYVHTKAVGKKLHRFFRYGESNEVMPDLFYRTTTEMFNEFSFLKDQKLMQEIVVDNSHDFVKNFKFDIKPIKKELCSPKIEGSHEKLESLVWKKAKEIYGENIDNFLLERIKKELHAVNSNGFDVIYWFSHLLVQKSIDDGYMVGSRGSVGSSFTAWLANITEVNPLPPHYLCKNCKHFEFQKDYESGFDLPDKLCPKCNNVMKGDGHNIPFETFMGFNGDKIPDIDLNFSAVYQSRAHEFIRQIFGKDKVFRAGTISTVAEKTAYGFVKGYFEDINKTDIKNAEIRRIALKCQNVKRTTGQHPGGIIIIPKEYDICDFTPYNYPADDNTLDWFTTHFAFEYLHDSLLKFDILGHDNPTVLKMLSEQTKIDPNLIPNNDNDVMELFCSTDSLKFKLPTYNNLIKLGTNGIPEFGTDFVKQMLLITKPKSFADLIRISGLSHGTQVWNNNAKTLIEQQNIILQDVIACRDDIMIYLINKNVDPLLSFKIMEDVRKGKGISSKNKTELNKFNVPKWYIDSCDKISYLFPKAHATAYVIMAWKIAWFKIHYPLNFYSAYFTIRINSFDISSIVKGEKAIIEKFTDIKNRYNNPATKHLVKNKEIDLLNVYELALEMIARNYYIKNIDLQKSEINEFIIENNYLIPPFSTIDGLGETVAKSIVEARKERFFKSKQDLLNRTKITKTHFKILESLGVLNNLENDDQLSLFGTN